MNYLLNHVESVAIIGKPTATPMDGALMDWLPFPLVPHLDSVGILSYIDGRVSVSGVIPAPIKSGNSRAIRDIRVSTNACTPSPL